MAKSLKWWVRKLHRWGAILFAVPLLIVVVSGLLLQVKKQVPWVQPPTIRGTTSLPAVDWDRILDTSRNVAQAEVSSWEDVDRIDVRISKGVLKVRCNNGWELQLDSATGDLLSSAYRRSDLIENIHDGSFFSEPAKLWIFLPNGIALLSLWLTGAFLWYLPFWVKQKKKKAAELKRESMD